MILTEYNEKLREKTLHEEGMEEGMELGRQEATAAAIRKLMTGMDMSADEAMDFLEIAENDRETYRKLL